MRMRVKVRARVRFGIRGLVRVTVTGKLRAPASTGAGAGSGVVLALLSGSRFLLLVVRLVNQRIACVGRRVRIRNYVQRQGTRFGCRVILLELAAITAISKLMDERDAWMHG